MSTVQITNILKGLRDSDTQDACFSFIARRLRQKDVEQFGDMFLRKLLTSEPTNLAIDDDYLQQLLGIPDKHEFASFFPEHLERHEYDCFTLVSNNSGPPASFYKFTVGSVHKLSQATDTGAEFQLYYEQLERLLIEYSLEEMERMRKRLAELESRLQPARLRHQEQGQYVYVFKDSHGTKVGKTGNMNRRAKDYTVMNPDGSMEHKVACLNCNLLEKVSHHILDQYHIKRNAEWLSCTDEIALEAVRASVAFLDGLTGYTEALTDFHFAQRVENLLKEYHEFYLAHPEKYTQHDQEPATHIARIQAGAKPAVPISKTVFGSGATVFTPHELLNTTDEVISFRDLRMSQNDPLDIERFLTRCFVSDPNASVMSSQIKHVYRIWSTNWTRGHYEALTKHLNARFKSGKAPYDSILDKSLKVYYGLRLKCIRFEPVVDTEFGQFVAETFIVDCGGIVRKTQVYDTYQQWKTRRNETLPSPRQVWKDALHDYLSAEFLYEAMVSFGPEDGQHNGYLGLSLPGDQCGKRKRNKEKPGHKVVFRCWTGGDIVKTFPCQAAASKFLGKSNSTSAISTAISARKPILVNKVPLYKVERWDQLSDEDKAVADQIGHDDMDVNE